MECQAPACSLIQPSPSRPAGSEPAHRRSSASALQINQSFFKKDPGNGYGNEKHQRDIVQHYEGCRSQTISQYQTERGKARSCGTRRGCRLSTATQCSAAGFSESSEGGDSKTGKEKNYPYLQMTQSYMENPHTAPHAVGIHQARRRGRRLQPAFTRSSSRSVRS